MTIEELKTASREGGRSDRFSSNHNVIVQPNRAELARTAAGMIAAASLISIAQRGVFNIALGRRLHAGTGVRTPGCRH